MMRILALAIVAVSAACARDRANVATAGDSATQQASVHPPQRLGEFVDYPAPAHLPTGFTFLREQAQPPDGFHKRERFGADVKQVSLIYAGPAYPGPTEGMRYPVQFIATKDSGRLSGTENQPGTPVTIRFTDGDSATATYWDGMWAPRREYDSTGRAVPPRDATPVWSREIFHALMFRRGDYLIGIRASHLNGATREELLKIAASTTATP